MIFDGAMRLLKSSIDKFTSLKHFTKIQKTQKHKGTHPQEKIENKENVAYTSMALSHFGKLPI